VINSLLISINKELQIDQTSFCSSDNSSRSETQTQLVRFLFFSFFLPVPWTN